MENKITSKISKLNYPGKEDFNIFIIEEGLLEGVEYEITEIEEDENGQIFVSFSILNLEHFSNKATDILSAIIQSDMEERIKRMVKDDII